MPRPRATNPLNLPPRVAYKHGAFYYRHRDGRWERLGTDIEQAKARGRHYADATSQHGTCYVRITGNPAQPRLTIWKATA